MGKRASNAQIQAMGGPSSPDDRVPTWINPESGHGTAAPSSRRPSVEQPPPERPAPYSTRTTSEPLVEEGSLVDSDECATAEVMEKAPIAPPLGRTSLPDDERETGELPTAAALPPQPSSGEVIAITTEASVADLETLQKIETADTVHKGGSVADLETLQQLENADTVHKESESRLRKSDGGIDGDDEESRLRRAGRWEELIERYLKKLESADGARAKADIFKRIAEIFHDRLEDSDQALDALVEALALDPFDNETVDALENLARNHYAWSKLVVSAEEAIRGLGGDREREAKLCEHIVRWYEIEKKQPELAEAYRERIRKLDPKHPYVQAELADKYRDQGSYALAREALQRAIDGLRRRERVPLYVSMGELCEVCLADREAAQHAYELALEIAPDTPGALEGLERILQAQEKYHDLEQVLDRQAKSAHLSDASRARSLMKLAELNEKHFLRYDVAAQSLVRVLDLGIDIWETEALAALERCQLAMRSWPELVQTLERRASLAQDPSEQAEFMYRRAEIEESKIGDLGAAIRTYERVLRLDDKGSVALSELARLSEKNQDWGAAAAYRSKLAGLSPDASQAAQLLVQIGDMLSQPGRDPSSARHYYERALTMVPSHAAAWEALQKDAERSGDPERIAYCLERRATVTDAPRLKAVLLVELARHKKQMGSEDGAFQSYEEAIQADPTNETAAAAVLPRLAEESRWQEAAPICELLVNAATRDGDKARAFDLLRLASRIATKMENLERALTASIAAYEVAPLALEAREELLAVAHAVRDRPELLERVKKELGQIAVRTADLSPGLLVQLGETLAAIGETDRAISTISRALQKDPENEAAFAAASTLYLALGDFEHAAAFKKKLAEACSDNDARYERFVEAGEIWAHRAKNLPMAAVAFEDALVLRPKDSWLLHTLMWAYSELESWDKLVNVLHAVVEIDKDPIKKAKGLYTMAQAVRDKLNDPYRAATLFEECIAVDPSRLDAFERVVRIYTEMKDWNQLEKSYRLMIHRTGDDEVELRHALFHQLGLIYRDRLGDAERAIDAFRAAGKLKPTEENRQIVTELYVVAGRVDDAIKQTRRQVEKGPQSRELYASLYDLFLRAHEFDKAWCAVSVLAHTGSLTPEQRKFHDDYPPLALSYVPGRLTPDAWRSHILHADLDPTLTALFAIMARAVTRVRPAQPGEPLQATHSYNAEPLMDSVRNACDILSIDTAPSLFARRAPPSPLSVVPAPAPALAACTETLDTLSRESLAFLVGKRLAELRSELIGRTVFPTMSEMTTAIATALRIVRGERAPDDATQAFDRELSASLGAEERSTLAVAVERAAAGGGKLDVKSWSQQADASSSRAGLLLCGHVEYAKRAMVQDGQRAVDLPLRARMQELCAFAVSDTFSDLRAAIGIGVST